MKRDMRESDRAPLLDIISQDCPIVNKNTEFTERAVRIYGSKEAYQKYLNSSHPKTR